MIADAGTWRVPDDVTVVFLSPVFGDTFKRVLANIISSIDCNPRSLRLIYGPPYSEEEIVRMEQFRQVYKRLERVLRSLEKTFVIYEHVPA